MPAAILDEAAARHGALGGEAFREELRALDPVAAERLFPGDGQRLQRAWAVARATGGALSDWQADATPPPPGAGVPSGAAVSAAPGVGRRRRAAVPGAMIAAGAIDEVRGLVARDLEPSLPVLKALGVPQIAAFLGGTTTLEDAVRASVVATRQYAKRQRTWFRHQLRSDLRIDAQFSESGFEEMFPKIRELVLTPPA